MQFRHWHAQDEAGRPLPPQQWPGARALRGETIVPGIEFRTDISGEDRWVKIAAAPVVSERSVRHAVVIIEEITGRKQAEVQRDLLVREVNHRSKNMLSVVQGVARASAGSEAKDFAQKFEERIQALSANQDLLVNNDWHGVDLADLVRAQLAHLEDLLDSRITLSGIHVLITAAASQALAMALHELATNATKYGALSTSEGLVQIAWDFPEDDQGSQRFRMCWMESGGPPVSPPKRKGFGSTVIDDMIRFSLESEVSLDYAPSGLVWELECPIKRLIVETRSDERGDAAPAIAPATKRDPAEPGAGDPYCILIVEDEAVVALALKETLTKAGFEVAGPAASVEKALAVIKRDGVDAAVLDVNLDSHTAEPIAEELARLGKPFVVVSAYHHRQLPPALSRAPLIAKPVQRQLLLAEISRQLRTGGDGREPQTIPPPDHSA